MSVKIRPHPDGGWEVDIRVLLPSGSLLRERRRAPVSGKANAFKWAEAREKVLFVEGKPKPAGLKKEVPTLKEFASRFLKDHAVANQQKPSGIAAKETILRVHLVPLLGSRRLDEIDTEAVQKLKSSLAKKAPKTVNNILTVLNTLLRVAVEWKEIDTVPCVVKLLSAPKASMSFHDFVEYEQLVAAASADRTAYLIVLLGGEAGLRCGEMMALEWRDVNWSKNQLVIERSEWKGHVTATKGGRVRHVPMTQRLAAALKSSRHVRSHRVLIEKGGHPLTQKVIQGLVRRIARKAGVSNGGVHVLRHTFCSHLAMKGAPARAIQELAGHQDLMTTQRYMHLSPAALDAAIKLLDAPTGLPVSGAIVEAAGTGA